MGCMPDPTLPPGRGKPGKEMMPEKARGFKLLGHCDFGGRNKGDVIQLPVKDGFIPCGHMGMSGTGVIDASNPRKPRVMNQIPAPRNTHNNKLQIVGGIMVVNNEQFGGRGPEPLRRESTCTTLRTRPNFVRWGISTQAGAVFTDYGSATAATPS